VRLSAERIRAALRSIGRRWERELSTAACSAQEAVK
jgi:hypothetical protein